MNGIGYSRRDFIRVAGKGGAGLVLLGAVGGDLLGAMRAGAEPAAVGLSDPALQPKFVNLAPNAADPAFTYTVKSRTKYGIEVGPAVHRTGLVDGNGNLLDTPIFGYGERGIYTWPGKTIFAESGRPIEVKWKNKLVDPTTGAFLPHLLPVDTSLHWAYSLAGYDQYSIPTNGIPIVAHLHGGHTDFQFDGNPEFFFSPGYGVRGPQWVDKKYVYDNDQPAGALWYHDHALGITRLNVYAGMAGFYLLRDELDTGLPDNELGLPAFPYELAYAIQDRMFRDTGELFYPAFPGDPFYDDFITGEGVELPPDIFPGGGPTALAEFFGDHIVVNGLIWPKEDVEPRNYRMRLLNGTDSRFMVLQFVAVPEGVTDPNHLDASPPLVFWVIGSDQGLGTPAETDTLVSEPGGRYDVVIDFSQVPFGSRVIMKNLGGDAPFGGAYGPDLEPGDLFPDRQTDRIMAFDVVKTVDTSVPDDFSANKLSVYGGVPNGATTRRVALFEGTDEFGRLQPLLGTVDALSGTNVATAYTWFQPTTETPALDSTEIWEIYNFTADAHPIHLHLVNFQILDREDFDYDITGTQTILQHNGLTGEAPEISNIRNLRAASVGAEYYEDAPKDMVTSLPGDPEGAPATGQLVRIKATFDKPGRYVWHCHILSHEDHEMMRVLHVGPGA